LCRAYPYTARGIVESLARTTFRAAAYGARIALLNSRRRCAIMRAQEYGKYIESRRRDYSAIVMRCVLRVMRASAARQVNYHMIIS
jgi:hypothetical protein